ncbi:MAG: hypothetical protein FJ291_29615, partial [Planctomycetes bacterium]|nr:hypothetical protein [Planctomycetota bacterium]
MTAEIAILNKEAVALAADSAVTVSETGGQKIFSSANKLLGTSQVLEPPRATLSAPRERKGELASGGPVPQTPWDLSHSATGTSPGGQRGHFPVGVPAARKRK